jgi:hypothetical protein
MKVRFNCNSGANIHSKRSEVLDLEKDLGITPEEWEAMDEDGKFEEVKMWADQRLEIFWEPVEDDA